MSKKDQKLKRQKEVVEEPELTMEGEDYEEEFEGEFANG
jgi:hypothetical protein